MDGFMDAALFFLQEILVEIVRSQPHPTHALYVLLKRIVCILWLCARAHEVSRPFVVWDQHDIHFL